jgi:hypothetical protein
LQSLSTEARFAEVIYGSQKPLCAMMCSWHHGFYFLQAIEPMQRIFDLSAASSAVNDPSGIVPGVVDSGRASSSCKSNGGEEEEGPVCLFKFLAPFFLSYVEVSRDLFVIGTALRRPSGLFPVQKNTGHTALS